MERIKIGVLVNTHGLKGEVKIKPMTDFPEQRFQKQAIIYILYQNEWIAVKIKSVREHKGMLLVVFENYEDINLVEQWKGSTLYVAKEQLHELEEDEAYFFELKGCDVKDENEEVLGKVVEVLDTPAHAILRVKTDDTTFLVPFVHAFIKSFDRSKKEIVIHKMEGLL